MRNINMTGWEQPISPLRLTTTQCNLLSVLSLPLLSEISLDDVKTWVTWGVGQYFHHPHDGTESWAPLPWLQFSSPYCFLRERLSSSLPCIPTAPAFSVCPLPVLRRSLTQMDSSLFHQRRHFEVRIKEMAPYKVGGIQRPRG
jgi:hypothetical protein